ncbi:hypothetical protein FQN60_001048, partial [Etheostoma spectabile]
MVVEGAEKGRARNDEVAPSVHSATHLPYDKKDESSAQHQGEHVAEGRKGECHGRVRQPDDEMAFSLFISLPPSFTRAFTQLLSFTMYIISL